MAKTVRGGIEVENLAEFRRALKDTSTKLPRELTKALKAAGKPPLDRVKQLAPVSRGGKSSANPYPPGSLRAGYVVRAAGSAASITNKVPYAGGADWGRFGKWEGFSRYPGPEGGLGRFAWRAVSESEERIAELMTEYLEPLLELEGWARP